MNAQRLPVQDRYAEAVTHDDGTLHNFTIRVDGTRHRCACGCNVFHKPDRKNLGLYQCNGCDARLEAV